MPRRKITRPVNTPADIRRLLIEYRSPVARRRERLQQYSAELVRLRREGAPWTELCNLISDPEHPYSILEIKDFIEGLGTETPEERPTLTQPANVRPTAAKTRPVPAPG